MTRLQAPQDGADVRAARSKAVLDAAADTALWHGTRITETQLSALQEAAQFTSYTASELALLVRGVGDCYQGRLRLRERSAHSPGRP